MWIGKTEDYMSLESRAESLEVIDRAVPTGWFRWLQDTTALKLEGRTCKVKARKLNFFIKSRILRKYYLNLFSIKFHYKPESPNRRETSSGILMEQIVPSCMMGKGGEVYCPQTDFKQNLISS